jgi:tripartite-type tricarboxylate transporter receptor subunit TctC
MTLTLRTVLLRAAAVAAMSLAVSGVSPAFAQSYPTKEITIVAASAPSGATDIFSRLVGKYMEAAWGKPVVVKNVAGAGGAVGAAQVKNAAPDGYTFVTSNAGTFSTAWQQMDQPTYTADDFVYIETFSGAGCAWVAKGDGPYKTMKDLIAAAKAGKSVSFGAFSSENKMYVDYIGKREGVTFKSVTMKSVPEVLQAVMGGHVDFGFSGGTHVQYVKKGLLRVVASTDIKRVPDSPDVPTLQEMGYGVTNCSVFMIAAPKGLPKEIVQKVSEAMVASMKTEEAKKYLESRESEAIHLGPEGLTKYVKDDVTSFATVTKALK